ncbi:plexin-C1-like protein [Lates japonicus]|uniref:Plexin-C1-like protein n=1 Tax=Lates japonicus TaxID=270547 RepID=A0AAD3QXN3_LATJO|nr:plexin-C1-like protein [Lates japonicus]
MILLPEEKLYQRSTILTLCPESDPERNLRRELTAGRRCFTGLLASSVIPGGPSVLWSGVFSVDGGQSNTELLVFDISPDLTGEDDSDPDFCSVCSKKTRVAKTLKPKAALQTELRPSSSSEALDGFLHRQEMDSSLSLL